MARDFSQDPPQPKAPMKVVTKCERVQPTVIGMDERGEFIWEGREMERWQMELLRVRYYGDFIAHWIKRKFFEHTGYESETEIPSAQLKVWEMSHEWKKKNRGNRLNTGD